MHSLLHGLALVFVLQRKHAPEIRAQIGRMMSGCWRLSASCMRGVELNIRMHAASSPVTPSDRMSCLPQPARYKCSEMSVAKSTRLQQAPHMQLGNRRPLRAGAAHLLDFLSLRLVLGFGFLVYRLLWRHAGPLLGCAAGGQGSCEQTSKLWRGRCGPYGKQATILHMPRLVSRLPKPASYAVGGCTAGPPPNPSSDATPPTCPRARLARCGPAQRRTSRR